MFNDAQQPCSSKNIMQQQTNKIHELPEKVSRKICTGQVIISLAAACRELIDNALDAGATNIEIRAKENGTECLEVIDNGGGIASEDFDKLCKPHCTSKLSDFGDLNSLSSYGFRGEALNALAALSDLQIITRSADSLAAWQLKFGRSGEILNRERCSRPQGTTVSITHLFKLLPVRRQELLRSARREFIKLVECVQAFALARRDCRFNCINIVNGKRTQFLASPGGSASLLDVISNMFNNSNGKHGLLALEEAMPSEEIQQLYGVSTRNKTPETMEKIYKEIGLSGYVSNCEPGQGRSSSDRQFVFVNRRHVDFPKLCRIANDAYSIYNRGQYCTLVLFVEIPPAKLDVNVSPDKRIVFLHHEKELFAKLRASLMATFAKVQGNCPATVFNAKNKKQKPISNLLRWSDSQQELKQEAADDEEEDDENEAFAASEESALNQSLIVPGPSESPSREDEEEEQMPNYSMFAHNAAETAINSTFAMGRENNAEILLENGEDEAEKVTRPLYDEEEADENSSAFIDESQFNPEDSCNLHDSFILAESTPIVYPHSSTLMRRQSASSTFDGITPIRIVRQEEQQQYGFTGFRSAATLFASNCGNGKKMAKTTNDGQINERAMELESSESTQERPTFSGFTTAAALFSNAQKVRNPIVDDQANNGMEEDEEIPQEQFRTPKNKRRQKAQKEGNSQSPRNWNVGRYSSAAKALEAFSFHCMRQGGMASTLHCRQLSQENSPLAEKIGHSNEVEENNRNDREYFDRILDFDEKTPEKDGNFAPNSPHSSISPSKSLLSPRPTLSADSIIDRTPPDTPKSTSSTSTQSRPHQPIHVNMQKLTRRFLLLRKRKIRHEEETDEENGKNEKIRIEEADDLGIDEDGDEQSAELAKREIERKLALMLKKSDFTRMQLIGQFNNAFLLARLGPQLFMIDQHAADEKFNFEWLQARAIVKSQRLFEAQPLQLGTLNVALLKDNSELFQKNGFEFQFDGNDGEEDGMNGNEAGNGQSVALVATPNISGYHFDKHDIDQLLSAISEMPNQLHRPPKIRAIFASRACRKSVMFGQSLCEQKMQEIIKNMGEMDHPWNCPHGRPTIRHLCSIHISQ